MAMQLIVFYFPSAATFVAPFSPGVSVLQPQPVTLEPPQFGPPQPL